MSWDAANRSQEYQLGGGMHSPFGFQWEEKEGQIPEEHSPWRVPDYQGCEEFYSFSPVPLVDLSTSLSQYSSQSPLVQRNWNLLSPVPQDGEFQTQQDGDLTSPQPLYSEVSGQHPSAPPIAAYQDLQFSTFPSPTPNSAESSRLQEQETDVHTSFSESPILDGSPQSSSGTIRTIYPKQSRRAKRERAHPHEVMEWEIKRLRNEGKYAEAEKMDKALQRKRKNANSSAESRRRNKLRLEMAEALSWEHTVLQRQAKLVADLVLPILEEKGESAYVAQEVKKLLSMASNSK